jgi:hypothetical protein
MENGNKTLALVFIAVVAMFGLQGNLYFAWHGAPTDPTIVQTITSTMKDIIVLIIGYLTGASAPDLFYGNREDKLPPKDTDAKIE